MQQPKQVYRSPEARRFGTVQDLTRVAGTVNPADVPRGQPMTAYPLS